MCRQCGKTISVMIQIKNEVIQEYKNRIRRLISVAKYRRKRGYEI